MPNDEMARPLPLPEGYGVFDAARAASGGKYEPAEDGEHVARLCDVISMGMQPGYQGAEPSRRMIFTFLTSETNGAGEPITVQHYVKESLWKAPPGSGTNNSALVDMLEAWFGVELTEEQIANFSTAKIYGAPVRITTARRPNLAGTRIRAKITRFAPAQVGDTDVVTDAMLASYRRPKGLDKQAENPILPEVRQQRQIMEHAAAAQTARRITSGDMGPQSAPAAPSPPAPEPSPAPASARQVVDVGKPPF